MSWKSKFVRALQDLDLDFDEEPFEVPLWGIGGSAKGKSLCLGPRFPRKVDGEGKDFSPTGRHTARGGPLWSSC